MHFSVRPAQIIICYTLGMRIWDVEPVCLCRAHLLGEHRELHALWTILSENRSGYMAHPETKRWIGKLAALYNRHEILVREMERRGYIHKSPLDKTLAVGKDVQDEFVHTLSEQMALLKNKPCECPVAL